jgi:DNA-binding protein HU-beta
MSRIVAPILIFLAAVAFFADPLACLPGTSAYQAWIKTDARTAATKAESRAPHDAQWAAIEACRSAAMSTPSGGAIAQTLSRVTTAETVSKGDLVVAIANRTSMPEAEAGKAIDALLDAITEALIKGADVRIAGFGTFSVTERSARQGRQPRTGEPVQIPASRRASFKAGRTLREALNKPLD